MKINHAILHILDFESAVNVISQRELDLEDSRACRQFVTTHLRRARESGDNKRATFSEESAFGSELKSFSMVSVTSSTFRSRWLISSVASFRVLTKPSQPISSLPILMMTTMCAGLP